MKNTTRAALRAATAALALAAAPCAAQTATPEETQDDTAVQYNEDPLGEIVVTARRVEENLQDTPISITAVTGEALERRQLYSTTDLSLITPNLQFTSYGAITGNNSASQVFIRGIGQTDPTPAVDPGVGLYIDEIYMGRAVGGAMDFQDIGNVQILRGPQGTLFGRNTIGGAVLITTRTPGDEPAAELRARAGSYDLIELFGALDLPIADTLRTRFSFGGRKRDGYVVRVVDGVDLGDSNTYTLRGTAVWEPSPAIRLTLRGDYSNADENGSPFVFNSINRNAAFVAAASVVAGCPGAMAAPANVPLIADIRCGNNLQARGPYTNGGTGPVESTTENWGVSGVAEFEANDWLNFKSITAYRTIEWTGSRDADNTPLPILATVYASESRQFSQELQAAVDRGIVKGVVGAYYFEEKSNDFLQVFQSTTSPELFAGGGGDRIVQDVRLKNHNWALFSQWTLEPLDGLSLTAGLRYTDETKEFFTRAFTQRPLNSVPLLPYPTMVGPGIAMLYVRPEWFEDGFSAVTGAATAQYRFSDAAMAYFSWSQGFKSGGFNQRYNAAPPRNEPIPFDSEEAETFELGAKFDIDDRLRLNAAVFTTDYTNLQLVYRLGTVPLLFNAGSARIRGFEVEATLVPVDGWIIDASVGHLDDQLSDVPPIPGATTAITSANSLPFTPEWKLSGGTSYAIDLTPDLELIPRADISYTSKFFFDVTNTEAIAARGVTTISANIRLRSRAGGWSAAVGVTNLTDEVYAVAGTASLGSGTGYAESIYSRPREWSLTVTTAF